MRRTLSWLVLTAAALAACTSTDIATDNPTSSAQTETTPETAETQTSEPARAVPEPLVGELAFEVVATYPHSTTSFTQGLEFLEDGRLVESVGHFEQSGRAVVDLDTGEQLEFEPLSDDEFAEGITQVGDELFQITWVNQTAIVSDAETLAEKRRLSYRGEGWGICFDGTELVMSDGSDQLTFRDPSDFSETRSLKVRSNVRNLVGQLNELECVGSQVWANVYFRNYLIAIDPETGSVEAWVDLESIAHEKVDDLDVMNGIAYRPETDTFFITGKNWPEIFELRLANQ